MVSANDVAAALVAKLKADTAIISFLTPFSCQNEVRELDYQGDIFLYPCIRVDAGTITPADDGVCHNTLSNTSFRIYCYSEKDSSYECSELVELVYNALNDKQLSGTGFSSTRMLASSISRPNRSPTRIWSSIVPFTVIVVEGE